jgi:predicted metal-dependent phosphoesterase TrpH
VRADLHSHSSASDGTDPPAEVMRQAAAAGLDVIALTDHDTVAGHRQARAALPPGLTLVPGIELSSRLDRRSVHLLGYLFDPADPALAAEAAAIRDSRVTRARAMVTRLEELGAPVSWDQVAAIADGGVVGRPHIARALAQAGVIASPAEAFSPQWIGTGGRAHVRRYAPDPGADSRGGPVSDEQIACLAAAGLAGIEVDHPSQDQAERQRLRVLAAELNLVVSGGSDDHGELTGHRLGCDTISPENYQRLVAQATGAAPVSGR